MMKDGCPLVAGGRHYGPYRAHKKFAANIQETVLIVEQQEAGTLQFD